MAVLAGFAATPLRPARAQVAPPVCVAGSVAAYQTAYTGTGCSIATGGGWAFLFSSFGPSITFDPALRESTILTPFAEVRAGGRTLVGFSYVVMNGGATSDGHPLGVTLLVPFTFVLPPGVLVAGARVDNLTGSITSVPPAGLAYYGQSVQFTPDILGSPFGQDCRSDLGCLPGIEQLVGTPTAAVSGITLSYSAATSALGGTATLTGGRFGLLLAGTPTVVPEPGTWALVGAGLVALAGAAASRRSARQG